MTKIPSLSPINKQNDPKLEIGFLKNLILKGSRKTTALAAKKALNFDSIGEKAPSLIPYPNKRYLLYIHIPFCRTLCPYCSFHKFKFEENSAKAYFELLRKELRLAKELGFDFVSLYVGGGTTTIMPDELARSIDLARELFSIREVSCEGDPDITDDIVKLLKDRIDRLSIGVQSFDDEILKKTGRYKKFGNGEMQKAKITKAIEGFKIVNLDFIFNIPTQSEAIAREDMRAAKALGAHQISTYPLMSSPLIKNAIEKRFGVIDTNLEIGYYKAILEELKGYIRLSAWSFAKERGVFDEYVVDYSEYLGLGSGAFSFLDDTLYINTFSLKRYKESIENNSLSIERYRKYSPFMQKSYRNMLALFSGDTSGLSLFEKRVLELFGMVDRGGEMSDFGYFVLLGMMKEFYIGMDFVRERSRESLKREDMTAG